MRWKGSAHHTERADHKRAFGDAAVWAHDIRQQQLPLTLARRLRPAAVATANFTNLSYSWQDRP